MRRLGQAIAIAALALQPVPVAAQSRPPQAAGPSLESRVRARLAEAGPGTRFGLVVTNQTGRELIAIDPDGRYVPASNTKIFTTAAAFNTLPVNQPDEQGGASVWLEGRDVVLAGHGDARLSSAPDCVTNCLAALADAVAVKTKRVRDVIGNDRYFPDQRWSPGMGWNNIPTRSGTGISALTLDDNELAVTVTPGAAGDAAKVAGPTYYRLDNRARTAPAGSKGSISYDRLPGSMEVRIDGYIPLDALPQTLRLGIDDPAHYAAWRLAEMLRVRGVRVTGAIKTRHKPFDSAMHDPAKRGEDGLLIFAHDPIALATLSPPPLAQDIRTINKDSQNVHAELLLRRVGRERGSGSIEDGVAAVERMMAAAGVPRTAWDLSDGSGMSTYNRVSPRAMTALLRWTQAQPWAAAFKASLPVGGVDGTLARRFKGTPLEGRIFAKTGTINATNALAGFITTASGQTLTFAFYANDVPGTIAASRIMDAALADIANAY